MGVIGALNGLRGRGKIFEKSFGKRVDKWKNMWYIIDKLKSDKK